MWASAALGQADPHDEIDGERHPDEHVGRIARAHDP
jgi:hypothetical protein